MRDCFAQGHAGFIALRLVAAVMFAPYLVQAWVLNPGAYTTRQQLMPLVPLFLVAVALTAYTHWLRSTATCSVEES